MNYNELIQWLLDGDVSIQYQVNRDLLGKDIIDLQNRIEFEGWGAAFLSKRNPDGNWGQKFYQPKWTSTHYTLLDLKNLSISPNQQQIRESINDILTRENAPDGGIRPIGELGYSDGCINGMFLNYASYFKAEQEGLNSVVDCILNEVMPDGGFNCMSTRSGAKHSSMHTTISILEGITEYLKNGYQYRIEDLEKVRRSSIEFLLKHSLYKSDHTGEIINNNFLKIPYPSRWKYDILRSMAYFRYSETPWDERMSSAMDVILKKRNKNQTWNVQAKYPGAVHFEMEKAGKQSRWNTLRVLRILKYYSFGKN